MKPFEEQYTAWVDGRLSDAERLAFEKELPDLAAAEDDRRSLEQLGHLLRAEATAPALQSADFFNHQLQQRIELDRVSTARSEKRGGWSWSLPKLAWAGIACLLAAALFYKTAVPPAGTAPASVAAATAAESAYFAEIVDVRTEDPNIYASTVYTPNDNVTVLWLEGLDYLPASYTLQN